MLFMLLTNQATSAEVNTVFQPKPSKEVQYNWGWGSPGNGLPADHFTALFDQSGQYKRGDYFIQSFADDGVKVEVDGKYLIDRWSGYTGTVDRALWLGVTEGQHTIKTHYLENVAIAAVSSHIVPLDSWLAYYYPNNSLTGMPTTAKIIQPVGTQKKLVQNYGYGAPAEGIPSDHFTARYTTAKRVQAGEYILRTKADNGIRVYVDGKKVIDRWTNGSMIEQGVKIQISDLADAKAGEKDIHWIEVEYREDIGSGQVEFYLESFQSATEDAWVGEIYPNTNFEGIPYAMGGKNASEPIASINFDWGWGLGSPHTEVKGDHFTARYTKKINLEAGNYLFTAQGDDAVRVLVDNKVVLDAWTSNDFKPKHEIVPISSGSHKVVVEYIEQVGAAKLAFDYKKMAQMPTVTGKDVQKNWGWGSPGTGIPADYFMGVFDQSGTYSSGDYFIQTFADDGVKMEVNGQWPINRWSEYTGTTDRALWLDVDGGRQHTVKTHYFEKVAGAAVFSHVAPLDSWLAYYYPNNSLTGMPTTAKIIQPVGTQKKLVQNYGYGAPAEGIPSDHFTARYTTAKRVQAGEYILRTKADNGIRVYVDGKKVIDRWTNGSMIEQGVKIQISDLADAKAGEKDIHWIEVEYREDIGSGQVEFYLESFQSATEDAWVGEIYPNTNFEGIPYAMGGKNASEPIASINFDWGWGLGSPHTEVKGDHFTARYTKKINLEAGNYLFTAQGDDAVRVLVDNKVVLDAWTSNDFKPKHEIVPISSGSHKVVVEYIEQVGAAKLAFDYKKMAQMPTVTGKDVQKNWGWGSPGTGIPADYFMGVFDQSGTYSSGDYFIQTFADDGVKMEVNGQWPINRWSEYTGTTDRALWLDVDGGRQHTVKTHYFEKVAGAAVFSHVAPLDSWLAYYYPNNSLTGMPTTAKIIQPVGTQKKLVQNYGYGAPAEGIPSDHFTARYTTAKRVQAGEYILRTKADNGIRVYVDGKKVIDRWTNGSMIEQGVKIQISDLADAKAGEKDIHWIEVEYREDIGSGQVEFYLESFQSATEDAWVGEIYPNTNFEGIPYAMGGKNASEPIASINFDWGWGLGSPHTEVKGDHFTARYTKKINLEAGNYLFTAQGDDAVRVLVDNKVVLDAWTSNDFKPKHEIVPISSGSHKVVVEYIEQVGAAKLAFDYKKMAQMPTVTGKDVQKNWGWGSPGTGIPADYFMGVFDQSGTYSSGDYFIQTFADDGVKMEVNGQWPINRWSEYTGTTDRALWLDVDGGRQHTVKTHYFEKVAGAAVFSHLVPLDSWLAYYYPNNSLTGMPTTAKIIQPVGEHSLVEDFGSGSPEPKTIPSDNFSARYTTAKRLQAGEYILRTKVDDGVRVYVDGKMVVDRWTNGSMLEDGVKIRISDRNSASAEEKDIHWIEVEYLENTGNGKVEFKLESFQSAIDNSWVGEIFPNQNFEGIPFVMGGKNSAQPISDINFSWGWGLGSPHKEVKGDQFTARYTKEVTLNAGTYLFNASGDDGIRVFLDGQLLINGWQNSVSITKRQTAYVESGKHTIVVEYYENVGNATLSFDYEFISPNKVYFQSNQQLEYTWRLGGPIGFPVDGFEALFDQSQYLVGGDYFIQTFADDGIKVKVNDELKINRWTDSGGVLDTSLMLNTQPGYHKILTSYYEKTGDAQVLSHVAPFDTWVSYYYPNASLSGKPIVTKMLQPVGQYKALSENNSSGSPVPNVIAADNFSAIYRTAKRIPAGEYVIRSKADDGIQVYVDGKLVLDRWTTGSSMDDLKISINDRNVSDPNEKNVHWIEVRYFEQTESSHIDFFLQPLADVMKTDSWVGYLYPNTSLQGNPIVLGGNGAQNLIQELNFDWGVGQPHTLIPADNFSAEFVKKAHYDAGTYQIDTNSDDGIQVLVDGKVIIDSWTNGPKVNRVNVTLNGQHEIKVKYFDSAYVANLKVTLTPLEATSYLEIDLRTRAKITAAEIESFFDRKNRSDSPLRALAQTFINVQEKYGVNAQYLVAHSILETGWGGSNLINFKNNLYGYGAYDVCPFTCGYYFPTKEASITRVAYQIRYDYLTEGGAYYNNPNLPGMNVRYATDPEWANKIARIMADIKTFDGKYYKDAVILQASNEKPASLVRDIPVGLPYPTDVIINFDREINAVVNNDGLKLRSLPYVTSSTFISSLAPGTPVRVIGYNTDVRTGYPYPYFDKWYRVNVNGQVGWLYGEHLNITW
ncbi:PA14 domain-containing protein [Bacillus sp. DJP31]|uniref:PA14 domain-containing protein n=1 Tax=Bacillus sp. DJP31 TaxID=3409789 RepID=UPI003BB51BE5